MIGRSGSLLLQSVLDGHPQVLMYPGIVNFYSEIAAKLAAEPTEWQRSVTETLQKWLQICEAYNIHRNLGDKGDESIVISTIQIAEIAAQQLRSSPKDLSRSDWFLLIHYAIGVYMRIDLSQTEVIYCHEHDTQNNFVDDLSIDFPTAFVVCSVRDPRSNFVSIQNWLAHTENLDVEAWATQKYIRGYRDLLCRRWYQRCLDLVNRHHDKFILVRLEDLQSSPLEYIERLAKILNIENCDALKQTTFGGRLWGGDCFSPRGAGFRNSAATKLWQNKLSPLTQIALEFLMGAEMTALGYERFLLGTKSIELMQNLSATVWHAAELRRMFDPDYYRYMTDQGHRLWTIPIRDIEFFLKNLFLSIHEARSKNRNGGYDNIRKTIIELTPPPS